MASDIGDYFLNRRLLEYYELIYGKNINAGLNKAEIFFLEWFYRLSLIWDFVNNGYYCVTGSWAAVIGWDTTNWPWNNMKNGAVSNFDQTDPPHWFYVISGTFMTIYTIWYATIDIVTLSINLPRLLVTYWKMLSMILLTVF